MAGWQWRAELPLPKIEGSFWLCIELCLKGEGKEHGKKDRYFNGYVTPWVGDAKDAPALRAVPGTPK